MFEKLEQYNQIKNDLPEVSINSYRQAFELDYTHNSTAIEGNTLTLLETKVVLEEGLSIGGKQLRELYEVINHNKAYQYVKRCITDGHLLNEKIIKDIHAILMETIMTGGIYRHVDVYISGAEHTPPSPSDMYAQIKAFYMDLVEKVFDNPIECAAWTHAEFVKIHPFVDGNGRTSRLIMNYQLMANGLLPISIKKESRLEYFNTIEAYAVKGDLSFFENMIAVLEEEQLDKYLSMSRSKF
ncbi:Fic family protein [Fusibacter sp. 3D3]|uniref:Fic family protein n=1 Tax=Fusibacter sp. 3D3 TaxID=1048380 RepID=UPI0008538FB3|nr:Fic family protein [Fusibacter sp. 3D3]GAU79805.1 filamentation induced by cAMP protein Fic [Fusibacter sp. 3D3]